LGENAAGLPALEERSQRELDEKREIAKAAAARINDGDAILLVCESNTSLSTHFVQNTPSCQAKKIEYLPESFNLNRNPAFVSSSAQPVGQPDNPHLATTI
jgi:hypothetical protein